MLLTTVLRMLRVDFNQVEHTQHANCWSFMFSAFVCLSVCLVVSLHLSRACTICYVIRYYVTAVYSSFWRFTAQARANEGSCVLPRW